jgi:hypothetical protein
MQYRLRTLMILFLFGPPVVYVVWKAGVWIDATWKNEDEWIVRPRSHQQWGMIGGPAPDRIPSGEE